MNRGEIKKFLASFANHNDRVIIIVDYGNVEKWRNGLGWKIGIRELAKLTKYFSQQHKFLRRFYYGADYGSDENSEQLTQWSEYMLDTARRNGFEVVAKRVKYIYSADNVHGFEKKCDLDVEMAIDLIKERENYDTIVLFSGDGDLMRAIQYLVQEYKKNCIVMSARGHVGREVLDAEGDGIIQKILFAEDFEYRLNMDRFRR